MFGLTRDVLYQRIYSRKWPLKKALTKKSTMKRINLGCGNQKLKGYTGVDIREPADVICHVGVDTLPFENNSVDEILCDNLMEHLGYSFQIDIHSMKTDKPSVFEIDEYLHAMNDCHRILKPEGELHIIVPDALNSPELQIGDPTHARGRQFAYPRSFIYLQHDHNTYKNYGSHYGFYPWIIDYDRSGTDNRFINVYMKPWKR